MIIVVGEGEILKSVFNWRKYTWNKDEEAYAYNVAWKLY